MYKGKKLEDSSLFNRTLPHPSQSQNTNQLFEREIDNYTRMLQQDKRRFFRLQENGSEVVKDHAQKNKQLDALKGKQFKSETLKKKGEMKILERELTQTINSYNEVLALNKAFKTEIEQLRKEKINQKEALRRLNLKIEELNSLIAAKESQISEKKGRFAQNKQQILKLKAENESESKQFREEVGSGRSHLGLSRSGHFFKRKSQIEQKNDATDSQPLVKYRLRQLINQNKQRIRIVQNYKKTMSAIWKSFEEIKEESGTSDLEEITSSFLKHEQQNHFIYEYINKLNKEIDDLNEDKQLLAQKIQHQKELNQLHTKQLGVTPEKATAKEAALRFQEECAIRIAQFDCLLRESGPLIRQVLQLYGFEGEADLTQFNLQEQLSQVQTLIWEAFPGEEGHFSLKEEASKYSKAAPGVGQQIRDKQQRLLEVDRLREYASDYWEKRRGKGEIK